MAVVFPAIFHAGYLTVYSIFSSYLCHRNRESFLMAVRSFNYIYL